MSITRDPIGKVEEIQVILLRQPPYAPEILLIEDYDDVENKLRLGKSGAKQLVELLNKAITQAA